MHRPSSEDIRRARPLIAPSLLLLGVLTAIDAMSIDSYVPALPAITRDLAASPVAVQGTLATFLIGIAVGQAFWGPCADRLGRRGPLLAGLVIYCIGSVGCALAGSLELLTAARFVQAIGASSGLVLSRAIVADVWPSDRTAAIYSLMMQILGVTALVSPLVGAGVLLIAGWRTIFAILLMVGVLSLAWSGWALPESLPPERRARSATFFTGYGKLLKHPAFMLAALASSFATATMFATLSGSPFLFVDRFGWTSGQFSFLYAGSSLAFIAICEVNQAQLKRRSAASLLWLAVGLQLVAAVFLVGLLPLPLPIQTWGFALGWIALMANLGILLGNSVSVAMELAPEEAAGTASAIIGVMQFGLSAMLTPLATVSANLAVSFALTVLGCAATAWGITALVLRAQARRQR